MTVGVALPRVNGGHSPRCGFQGQVGPGLAGRRLRGRVSVRAGELARLRVGELARLRVGPGRDPPQGRQGFKQVLDTRATRCGRGGGRMRTGASEGEYEGHQAEVLPTGLRHQRGLHAEPQRVAFTGWSLICLSG